MERKKVTLRFFISAAILIVVFLPGFSELQRIRDENDQFKKRIQLLEEHNEKLKHELVKLREDPVYIEKKAREKLGVIKKGEIIYNVPEE